MARIVFLGDVMLGRLVSDQLRSGLRPERCWGDVAPLLQASDGVIANLECAITVHDEPWLRTPKVFHFRADPLAIEVLKAGNIRALSLANNHILDFEVVGLIDTLDRLDEAGISHAGAGRNVAEAFRPARFIIGNIDVALFAVTDNEPEFAAKAKVPGTAFVDASAPQEQARPTAQEIDDARCSGADLTILSCHLGPNMVTEPALPLRIFRRGAARRGIDVVHGHSAHLTQGIERIGRSLVLHDTGDFLDDYATDTALHNDWSFIFILEADRAGLRRLTLVPVVLGFAQARRATVEEANRICGRMIELSAKFGTAFVHTDHGLELDLVP